MSGNSEVYGDSFEIQATADTTEDEFDWNTGIEYVTGDPKLRVRKVIIVNDGSVALLYTLNGKASSATNVQHSLAAAETITHHVISPSLWVETGSSTAAFRAWGEG